MSFAVTVAILDCCRSQRSATSSNHL